MGKKDQTCRLAHWIPSFSQGSTSCCTLSNQRCSPFCSQQPQPFMAVTSRICWKDLTDSAAVTAGWFDSLSYQGYESVSVVFSKCFQQFSGTCLCSAAKANVSHRTGRPLPNLHLYSSVVSYRLRHDSPVLLWACSCDSLASARSGTGYHRNLEVRHLDSCLL